MKQDIVLNLYSNDKASSVIRLTEEANSEQASTVNTSSKVQGPDGVIYDMDQLKDYVEASVDYIEKITRGYLHPFLSKLIRCFTFAVPTMMTDGVFIFMNPGFTKQLVDSCNGSLLGVAFVLIHEIYHNLFQHFDRVREQPQVYTPYDADLVNAAQDYEINWIITQTMEDPRTEDEYDPNDPLDSNPYELDANGNLTSVKNLIFKNIVKQIGAGLLDAKYAGWTAEDIYQDLIKHPGMTSVPPKKMSATINHTTSNSQVSPVNGKTPPGPDEVDVTYNLDPDERTGYEDGWAQAITELRAKGILESIEISKSHFMRIMEAAVSGDPSYDKGFDNGYQSCMKTVQTMLENAKQKAQASQNGQHQPKINPVNTPPHCDKPILKNVSDPNNPKDGDAAGKNPSTSNSNNQGQGSSQQGGSSQNDKSDSSIDPGDIQDIIDQVSKIAQAGGVNSNGSSQSQASQDNAGVAQADGDYTGKDEFTSGAHVISQEEGAEIAQHAGITMDEIMKNGNDGKSVFDNDSLVQNSLKQINKILDISLNKRKQPAGHPGRGLSDKIQGILTDIGRTTIDWKDELSSYFSGRTKQEWIGYNNNYIWDDRYEDLEDYDEPDALDKILIFLDTSGSMMSSTADVAKCIHNIKDIIRDTDAIAAEIYLFADGIYYGAPLDVSNITDNYDTYHIKLPIRSGGTSYMQIFKVVQQHIDEGDAPDCVVVMTDSDIYSSFSEFPTNFEYADNFVFLIVDDSAPKKLPFGDVIYVSSEDFKKVAKHTALNESSFVKSNVMNMKKCMNRKIHMLSEGGFKMPVKIAAAAADAPADGTTAVSSVDPIKHKHTVTSASVIKANLNAIKQNSDEWRKRRESIKAEIKKQASHSNVDLFRKIFVTLDDSNISITAGDVVILVSDNATIDIYGNIFLYGDNMCAAWDKFFDDIFAMAEYFTFGTMFGNFTIGMCATRKTLPMHMPMHIHCNINILNMPKLITLRNLPTANVVNVQNCPNIPQVELDEVGAVTESAKAIKKTGIATIVESRIAAARKFKALNESILNEDVLNEDFNSTKLAKIFSDMTGSKNEKTAQLTEVSKANRDILSKIDQDVVPIMWSEITDDMITETRPEFDARAKACLERRDQNTTNDWGLRIVCDEDGKIMLIITGDNRSMKNPDSNKEFDKYLYDWTNGKSWLYVDLDLINLINSRADMIANARMGFSIYANAVCNLHIVAPDVKYPDSPLLLTNMSNMQAKVNNSYIVQFNHPYSKNYWQVLKNKHLYTNFTSGEENAEIKKYYNDVLLADPADMSLLDSTLATAQNAIDTFKPLHVDYTKSSLSRINKVNVITDNSALGYHIDGMVVATAELVPDKLVVIYDIDSKHGSRAQRLPGDATASLGSINPYDKDIIKNGYFDIEKNRENDEIEKAKFGFLNNTRKRRIIQNARKNSIIGSYVSDKGLNDPRLRALDAKEYLFTSNTERRTESVFTTINDMLSAINTRFMNTSTQYDSIYATIADRSKRSEISDRFDDLKDLIATYMHAGNNLLKQIRIADSLEARSITSKRTVGTVSRGYRDTISSQLADAFDDLQKSFRNLVSAEYDISIIEDRLYKAKVMKVEDYFAKDKEDLQIKADASFVHRDPDLYKTSDSMKYYENRDKKNRAECVRSLTVGLDALVSGYSYIINAISDLRSYLKNI